VASAGQRWKAGRLEFSPMGMASALSCTGPMFSLKTPNSFFVVRDEGAAFPSAG
jgi:hypothetical protein